jgi:hypothetical protein
MHMHMYNRPRSLFNLILRRDFMNLLTRLETKPESGTLRKLLILGLILFFIAYPLMSYFFSLSGYETNVIASQLSFSGLILKTSYAAFIFGDLESYRIGQMLDYIFMVSYGIIIFALATSQARKIKHAMLRKWGFFFAIGGICAALLDAIENVFILATLTNPFGFPDWWAVAHSCFALPKWILLIGALSWYLFAYIAEKTQN